MEIGMEKDIKKVRDVCELLRKNEKEAEIDQNFWAVNTHGDEIEDVIKVPKGVRIIMFCYPGRKLDICPRFDRFNWEHIFLNEDATFNYCTFLATLSQYSSLKKHFCIYDAGSKLKDLKLTSDENFRDGIYKLPVMASVRDENLDTMYVSSEHVFPDVVERMPSKRIVINRREVAKRIKYKQSRVIFFTKVLSYPIITLSMLLRKLQIEVGSEKKKEFTILLLTCRTGEKSEMDDAKTVDAELRKLFKLYEK